MHVANCVCAYAHVRILKWKLICVCAWAQHWRPPPHSMALSFALASSSICFMCFRCMFHLDVTACVLSGRCKIRSSVANVAMAIHVCCKCMFLMFQLFQTYIASLCACCICCSCYTHVASVYFKCFTCFRCMLQQVLYIASVFISRWSEHMRSVSSGCCICCNDYTRILQVYVLAVSNVGYKCFI
jgi:hypothetical protein